MVGTIKKFLDLILDLLLTEEQQFRLGMHIANRARGDDNYDPKTNGEYWALHKIKKQFLNQKLVIFDVGAHVGEWTKEAWSGETSQLAIHSFEPTRTSFLQLERWARETAPSGGLYPVNAALSDRDGTGTLHIDGDLCGTNSLNKHLLIEKAGRSMAAPEKVAEVTLIRGDSFCREKGIERIHFLKIDAESEDVSVLRGFEGMLSRGRIDYVQFEYFHGWIDAGRFLHEALGFLIDKGYRVGKLRGNRLMLLDSYDKSLEKFEYANYFALRPEAVPLWR